MNIDSLGESRPGYFMFLISRKRKVPIGKIMPFGIGGQKKNRKLNLTVRKVSLALLNGFVVTSDVGCKARHLSEETEEKEDEKEGSLSQQLLYNHNFITYH